MFCIPSDYVIYDVSEHSCLGRWEPFCIGSQTSRHPGYSWIPDAIYDGPKHRCLGLWEHFPYQHEIVFAIPSDIIYSNRK